MIRKLNRLRALVAVQMIVWELQMQAVEVVVNSTKLITRRSIGLLTVVTFCAIRFAAQKAPTVSNPLAQR